MRKIKSAFSQKDRIICQSIPNKLMFSYKAADSKESKYLFETAYSPSLYAYFRDKGCRNGNNGYGLTVGQFYRFRDYHNVKLAKALQRVPAMVDYVLMDEYWDKEYTRAYQPTSVYNSVFDDERAA